MIYITQLIYVQKGREDVFYQFEAAAIPIIKDYGGKILLRVRPGEEAIIEGEMEAPYEIHLVSFPSEEDFEAFQQDEERKRFLHLKDQSIKSAILIKGETIK